MITPVPSKIPQQLVLLAQTWLPGSILYLALVLAGLAADEQLDLAFRAITTTPASSWTAWAGLPLALIVIALVRRSTGQKESRGVCFALGILAISLVAFRLYAGYRGPLFYLALREAIDLGVYCAIGIALWLYSQSFARGAIWVWLAALATIFLARMPLGDVPLVFRPDLLPASLSIPWALLILLKANRGPNKGSDTGRPRFGGPNLISTIPARGRVVMSQTTAIAAGLALTFVCLSYVSTGAAPGVAEAPAIDAMAQGLWSQSVLAGWGRAGFLRLLRASAAPLALEPATWMGPSATLAMHGFLFVLGAALVGLGVLYHGLRSASDVKPEPRTSASWSGLLAATSLVTLIVFGGPNSSLPTLLAIGWLALGGSDFFPSGFRIRLPSDLLARFPANLTLVHASRGLWAFAFSLAFLAALPSIAGGKLAAIRADDLRDPLLGDRLAQVRMIHPWHPTTYLIEAAWLREGLRSGADWSEPDFERACEAYRSAQKLDPFDPNIPLRLQDLQARAGHADEAYQTARAAARSLPGASAPIQWAYLHAASHGRPQVAEEFLRELVRFNPEQIRWRRLVVADAAGRGGPQSAGGKDLGIAMTSVIGSGDPMRREIVQTSFTRSALGLTGAGEADAD